MGGSLRLSLGIKTLRRIQQDRIHNTIAHNRHPRSHSCGYYRTEQHCLLLRRRTKTSPAGVLALYLATCCNRELSGMRFKSPAASQFSLLDRTMSVAFQA